ncbi:MAG TPA: hypothetical protein VEA41_01860 [Salinarimonas sp.]|nr:hypothetical protein [Salinarimonas sp.]
MTDAEKAELQAVCDVLLNEAENLAKAGQVRLSGLLLTARQTLRWLATRIIDKDTPAPLTEPGPG